MKPAVLDGTRELPAKELLRVMALSREGDRREGILLRQSRGWFQVAGDGHEALAAIAYHLRPDDLLFPYYRDRALMLARGMSDYELALAFFAKAPAAGAGRQMHGHYGSRRLNVFPVATPTASQCLPAAGAAWAARQAGGDSVVVCTVGDASLRQGEYYEAICLAIQESLPLLFVVEDNLYGISTNTTAHNPYRLGIFGEEHVVRVNGRDPHELFQKSGTAVARARKGGGPTVLWCEIDRLCSHTSSDDHRVYRTEEEIAAMRARDPLHAFAASLISEGRMTEAEWADCQEEVAREVERDYLEAEQAPDPLDAVEWLYAPAGAAAPPPEAGAQAPTIVGALNATLAHALETDERVLLFGEDIEDPKGGVFGFTKGLSTRFPGRVRNSPLAEATIIGAGAGLAAAGMRPVFEIQFIDFILPGINQLITQAATLRWRSAGEWACPLVLIAPCGAYLPGGGPWHSQSNEGLFTHVPGLRVVCPSTPADAAGLLWTALKSDDPTLILVPKHIFRKRMEPSAQTEPVPFGRAALRREGTDVTLVCWGNGTELAAEAAEQASARGTSVEVIDLRSLNPGDWEALERSVAKTGRLVVLQEDTRTASFGQAVVAEMTARADRWGLFFSAPQLVTREDVPVPYSPPLEYAVLPDVGRLLAAIEAVMA